MIALKERQRRQAAIDFARGSVRFEGFVISAEAEAIGRQFGWRDDPSRICRGDPRDQQGRAGFPKMG